MPSSLRPILAPRSLAVVGVSSRPDSLSGKLLANLQRSGFAGDIWPVNPRADTIAGLPCFASLRDLPAAPDLAIVMVPRDAAVASVRECAEVGVGGVVVITAGFREAGADGGRLERELVEILRARGIRMIGPNCMGLINTAASVRLDATFSPVAATPGPVAFASHSGALGVAVLESARENGLAIAQFVSLGNSADVGVCDLLEAWAEDPAVGVVLLYLETIEEPRRFLAAARHLGERVPVVVLKAGRSEAGQRAASSHTGALAADDAAVEALLRQAGVLRAGNLGEMVGWTVALQSQPLPAGRRLAIVTNAGGPAIAAADAAARHGLALADLSAETRSALRAFLPAEAATGNPVDMLPSASPDDFRRAVELTAADPGVDGVVTITVTPILYEPVAIARAVAAAERADTPILSVFMTAPEFYVGVGGIPALPPVFRLPEDAVGAFAAMVRCRAAQSVRHGTPAGPSANPVLSSSHPDADGFLPPEEAFAVLAAAGLAVAPFAVADEPEGAGALLARVGAPAVMKVIAPGVVHKTEVGGVVLGIETAEAAVAAAHELARRARAAGAATCRFLVQRQVRGGAELILGLSRKPGFGTLVMCGLGGVAVEVFHDVSFRLAPVDPDEALRMLDELAASPMLDRFRGRAALDRAAVAGAIAARGQLAAGHPEISELDVNPLIVLAEGCVAVDARVRITP